MNSVQLQNTLQDMTQNQTRYNRTFYNALVQIIMNRYMQASYYNEDYAISDMKNFLNNDRLILQ